MLTVDFTKFHINPGDLVLDPRPLHYLVDSCIRLGHLDTGGRLVFVNILGHRPCLHLQSASEEVDLTLRSGKSTGGLMTDIQADRPESADRNLDWVQRGTAGEEARPDILTIEQSAERIGISPRTMRRIVGGQRIKHLRIGRLVRISSLDLNDFVDRCTIEVAKSTPEVEGMRRPVPDQSATSEVGR